jgi:hypothetical protein
MYSQGAHWFSDGFIDDVPQNEGSSSSHARLWQQQNDSNLEDESDVQHFFAGRRPGIATIEDTHTLETSSLTGTAVNTRGNAPKHGQSTL